MGDMRISRSLPTPPKTMAPPVPKASSEVKPTTATTATTATNATIRAVPAAPTRKAPPPPPRIDVSTPEARSSELSAISNPNNSPRRLDSLPEMKMSGPSQDVRNAGNLVGAMNDEKFTETLSAFSPSLGQRFLQACGKSTGSVDGGRFKKNALRMLPVINIGAYGRDAVRAHKSKEALNGIAAHASANHNQLARQLAESLGAHEKSKRNTQAISGAVAVVTSAVAFVPGAQAAPALTGAAPALASTVGALGMQYTAAAAIDSSIRTVGSAALSTAASFGQDYAVTQAERNGEKVAKTQVGSGYGKLKVSSRIDENGSAHLETEMGYQAARALVNYLGPAQRPDESADSPRMQLRQSLGATDAGKTYSVPDDKIAQRQAAKSINPEDGRTDYLQMFFDIGVKGAGYGG